MRLETLEQWAAQRLGGTFDLTNPENRAKVAQLRAMSTGGYGPAEHPMQRAERMQLLSDTRPAVILLRLLREQYVRGDTEVDEYERRVDMVMWRARCWGEDVS